MNTLDNLERFLRAAPLPRGWGWDEIGLDPTLGESGIIVLSLKNPRKGRTLKIALFKRDAAAPCYSRTAGFNITALRGAGETLKPEEIEVVETVSRAIGVFDRGGFAYPKAEKPGGVISSGERAPARPPMAVFRDYNFVGAGRSGRNIALVLPTLCDWKCAFCAAHGESAGEALPDRDEEILAVVKKRAPEWREAGISAVSITGSEPLNSGIFTELVNFLTETLGDSSALTVQTTGAKLNDGDFIARIARPEQIVFDLPVYGPDAASHDEITGVAGSFDAVAGILRDSKLKIRAHTILLKKNIARLREIRGLRAALGRGLSFIVLYASEDRDVFAANAPRLSEAAKAVRQITSGDEFAEFAFSNRERIPPCVTGIEPPDATTEISCAGADGGETKAAIWDKINPDLIPCLGRNECRFGALCPGVYSAYILRHGWGEFIPVK